MSDAAQAQEIKALLDQLDALKVQNAELKAAAADKAKLLDASHESCSCDRSCAGSAFFGLHPCFDHSFRGGREREHRGHPQARRLSPFRWCFGVLPLRVSASVPCPCHDSSWDV